MKRALSGPGTEHAVRHGDRHTVCGYPLVEVIAMARVAMLVEGEFTGQGTSCRRCAERLEAAENIGRRPAPFVLPKEPSRTLSR